MRRPPSSVRSLLALALAGTLVLAGCGDDDADDGAEDSIVSDVSLVPVDDTETTDGGAATDDTGADTGDGTPEDTSADTSDGTPDDTTAPVRSPKPEVNLPAEIPTELVVTDLTPGTGRVAEAGDIVVVDYVGVRAEDGAEFDNSYDREIPFDVLVGEGRVITGWDEGLVGVQAGGRRQLDIPAELAYGDNPQSGSVIQPGDALTFVVDVRAVVGPVTPEDAPLDVELEPSVGRDDVGTLDVTVGDGAELTTGQSAIVHVLLLRGDNQVVMYDTWSVGDPIQVVMEEDATLSGLVEGLAGMRVGGLRVISIPPDQAFGAEGNSEIGLPGDVDLIVVAELLGAY